MWSILFLTMSQFGAEWQKLCEWQREKTEKAQARNDRSEKQNRETNDLSDTGKTLQTNNNSGEFPDCRSFSGNVGVRDEGGEEELE